MSEGSVKDVQQVLDAAELGITIREFDESTATSQEAANAIGTELGTIVKSLCFMIDGKPVIVLAAGDKRVDAKKLAVHFGVSKKRVKIAKPEETLAATGYLPGGVPPMAHTTEMPILIDETLGRFEKVYAAAGSPHSIFPIDFGDLIEVTRGEVIDLARAD